MPDRFRLRDILLYMLPVFVTLSAADLKPGDKFPAARPVAPYRQGHPFQIIIFWDSNCPDCVKKIAACERQYRQWSRAGASLATINSDQPQQQASVRAFIEDYEITFPVLYDPDRKLAGQAGCDEYSFSYFIIDSAGVIRALHYNQPPSGLAAIDEALKTVQKAPAAAPPAPPARVTWQGRQRIRWSYTSGDTSAILGTFNEPLERGQHLLYHLELEARVSIVPGVDAGGLLRVSNEGADVLAGGPQYFSSGYGSAFLRVRHPFGSVTAGYYPIHFSPLLLMRWDPEDTPVRSGEIDCGACGGTADRFGFRNLEPIAPELYFEGGLARGELASGHFGYDLFYAVPNLPRQAETVFEKEDFQYHRDLFGGRITAAWPVPVLAGPVALQAGLVRSVDDTLNPLPASFIICRRHEENCCALDNTVLGGSVHLPLLSAVQLHADYAYSRTAYDRRDTTGQTPASGHGAVASLVLHIKKPPRWQVRLAAGYLYLDSAFVAPYSALSYVPNRTGPRVILQAEYGGTALSLFYKQLQEPRPELAGNPLHSRVVSVSAEQALPRVPVHLGLNLVLNERRNEHTPYTVEEKVIDISPEIRYTVNKYSYLSAVYHHIMRDHGTNGTNYTVRNLQVLTVVEF